MNATSVPLGSVAHEAVEVVDSGSRFTAVTCRLLDIGLAAVALVLLSPVLLVIAIAIRLDSPGRVLFRQERLGRRLEPFTINKFRTMTDGAAHDTHRRFVIGLITANGAPQPADHRMMFKLTKDERITRVGRFLRRSSLDELPQLFNVLKGSMSLVGPRPPIPYEVEHYPAHWYGRFAVKPGLTGLWQVSGRCELTLEEMIRLDIDYAQRRSLWLNAWIILRTPMVVLHGTGAA